MKTKRCRSCGVELPSTVAKNTIFCGDCRKARKRASGARRYPILRAKNREAQNQAESARRRTRIARLNGVSRADQIAMMTDADKARFWSKVDTSGDCWIWTGRFKSKQPEEHYGLFYLGGRDILAHRVAYQLTHSPIPDGLFVCHRCDNPPCCNPAHLFPGDQLVNMHDMAAKKRHWQYRRPEMQLRGERVKNAKLTEDQVREIRALARSGVVQREIARRFGIDQKTAGQVIRRKTWKHVADREAEDGQSDLGTSEGDRDDRDRSRHAA